MKSELIRQNWITCVELCRTTRLRDLALCFAVSWKSGFGQVDPTVTLTGLFLYGGFLSPLPDQSLCLNLDKWPQSTRARRKSQPISSFLSHGLSSILDQEREVEQGW